MAMHLKNFLLLPRMSSSFAAKCAKARPSLPSLQQLNFKLEKRYTTDASSTPFPIYELRNYHIHPKNMKEFIQLAEEHFHERTKHSKLLGFWTAEVGDVIMQVVHIWEYESLSHRRSVRKALTTDSDWLTKFVGPISPMLDVQINKLLVATPPSQLDLDFADNPDAVYVLQSLNGANKQRQGPEPSAEGEKLVGRFTCILGPENTEFRLWRYQDIDSVTKACWKRVSDSPAEGNSLMLYPTSLSPMK